MSRALGIAVAVIAAALATAAAAPAWACAGCRNPNIPQTRAQAGPLDQRAVSLGVSATSTWVDVSHPAGCEDLSSCSDPTPQPLHTHDLSIVPVELRIMAGYAITDTVGVELDVPVRLVSTRVDYFLIGDAKHATPYEPLDEGVHHRDEVLVGLADLQARVRAAGRVGRWWLTGRAGITLPTGRTEPDPFALGDEGIRHQHIQFGSGTVDPVAAFDATRSSARMEWSLYAQGQASLYENRHGFQGPYRALVGALGGWKPSPPLLLSLGVEGAFEGPERWQGVARSDGSLGRQELLVGPQMLWAVGRTTLTAMARFPVARNIVEGSEDPGTLRSPVSFGLGAFWALGGG